MEHLKKGKHLVHLIAMMAVFALLTGRSFAAGHGEVDSEYKDQSMQILDYNQEIQAPDGFEEKSMRISDTTVDVLENEDLDLTLVLAEDESGEKNLYIYQDGAIQTIYQTLEFGGQTYTVLALPSDGKDRVGYRTDTIELQGKTVEVWKSEKDSLSDYCQMYLMNPKGEAAVYQYEATEGTIQKVYETEKSVQEQESVENTNDENEYELLWDRLEIYFAIGVFAVLVVITLAIGPGKVKLQVHSRKRAEYYAEKIEASYGDLEAVMDSETLRKTEEKKSQSQMMAALQKNIYVPVLVSAVYEDSHITVTWQTSDSVQGYNVYRKTVNGKWKCIKQIQGNKTGSYTDIQLETNTMYTYTVRAYVLLGDEVVLSDYNRQGITEVALHGYQPFVPKLKEIRKNADGVTIKWQADPEVDSYMVYRKENGGKWDKIDTIDDPENAVYTDTNVQANTLYEYTVRSRKEWGNRVYDSEYQNPGLKITFENA